MGTTFPLCPFWQAYTPSTTTPPYIKTHRRHHDICYLQVLPETSDEDEIGNPPGSSATVSGWVDDSNDDDDIGFSDSMTVLIESDPIAAAAGMNTSPNKPQSGQTEFNVYPIASYSVRHDSNTRGDGNMSQQQTSTLGDNNEDTPVNILLK